VWSGDSGISDRRRRSVREESVRIAEALLPDLLLIDINLPGTDGLVATRRLRENADHPPVALLLSTQDEHVGDGYAAETGAAAYIL
jgi:CheY-like chemotaxis protein